MSLLVNHHILPKELRGRDVFKGLDPELFNIDAPENLIYLPGDEALAIDMDLSRHAGGHVSEYVQTVDKVLDEINTIGDPHLRAAEIRTLITAMRVGFANGDLHTNVSRGKTREEVTSGILKVIKNYKGYLAERPEQHQAIRDLEQKATAAGLSHLIKWSAILDNPERMRLLNDAIARNPAVNITSRNKDLAGTPWDKQSTPPEPVPYSYPTPGFDALKPEDVPTLPGSTVPSFDWLNKPEEFTRSDPRFAHGLPAFPAIDPATQGLGQLPPSTAAPQDPLILQFDPATGWPLPFPPRSPILEPDAPSNAGSPSPAASLAGLAAVLAIAFPEALLPLAPIIAAGLFASAGGASATSAPNSGFGTDHDVFSSGAAPYNSFGVGQSSLAANNTGYYPAAVSAAPATGSTPLDQTTSLASPFADRFGNWTETSAGTMPAQPSSMMGEPSAGASRAAPEDMRRLTRVNETNSANAFASGATPVPYLPPSEFNDRFGQWRASSGGQSSVSGPVGTFADEPTYTIPPPIWGMENPGRTGTGAEDWFTRWIQPFMRRD